MKAADKLIQEHIERLENGIYITVGQMYALDFDREWLRELENEGLDGGKLYIVINPYQAEEYDDYFFTINQVDDLGEYVSTLCSPDWASIENNGFIDLLIDNNIV